jgi:hypothetical protein
MSKRVFGSVQRGLFYSLVLIALSACASGGSGPAAVPPSAQGIHTIMGRAFFPGGIMIRVDAHLEDGQASGTLESTEVTGGGESTLRIVAQVECIGLFEDRTTAVITGPITEKYGDRGGRISALDWWILEITDGGQEGDLIWQAPISQVRAMEACNQRPASPRGLRAVDGDISIY